MQGGVKLWAVPSVHHVSVDAEPFLSIARISQDTYCMQTYCIRFVLWMYKEVLYMDIVKVFGTNLKNYRTAMGLSQEAFAEKCGLHRTYISAIECYRRSISLENIQRIADALEIETYKLFLGEEFKK